MLLVSTAKKIIRYISNSYVGTAHDFMLMQWEFLPEQNWFKDKKIRLDSGFQGFEGLYPVREAILPQKKPKNKTLSDEAKLENQLKAQKRVVVEHSIAGLKRFRILSDRLRMHDFRLYDEILGVCAALWNFNFLITH